MGREWFGRPRTQRAAVAAGIVSVRSGRVKLVLLTVLPVWIFMGVDPWGWDHFVPLRFAVLIPLITALFAATLTSRRFFSMPAEFTLFATLLVWLLFATLVATDRLPAWIGTPERRLGFLAWVLFGLCLAVGLTLTAMEGRWLIRAFVLATGLAGSYTALELVDLVVDVSFAGGRLGGPFGQPAMLGAAMLLGVPISVGLAADTSSSVVWRRVGAICAALGAFALVASASRAAFIAVVIVAIAAVVRHMPRIGSGASREESQRRSDRRRGPSGQAGMRAVSAANQERKVGPDEYSAHLSARPERHATSEPKTQTAHLVAGIAAIGLVVVTLSPVGERLVDLGRGGLDSRIDEWQVASRAIVASPIVGVGPEGYRLVFGEVVDDEYVLAYGRQTVTDRAHSAPLDLALIGGVPLAMLYLALAWSLGRRASRLLADGGITGGIAAAVLAYMLHQLVFFPLADIDLLFWLLAGVLVSLDAKVAPTLHLSTRIRTTSAALLVAATGIVIAAGVVEVVADHRVSDAVNAKSAEEATAHAEAASHLVPWSVRYSFIASRVVAAEATLSAVERSIELISAATKVSPRDPSVEAEVGRLLLESARLTLDPEAVAAAVRHLETVVGHDPADPNDIVGLGLAYVLLGDVPNARASFERASTLGSTDATRLKAALPESPAGVAP